MTGLDEVPRLPWVGTENRSTVLAGFLAVAMVGMTMVVATPAAAGDCSFGEMVCADIDVDDSTVVGTHRGAVPGQGELWRLLSPMTLQSSCPFAPNVPCTTIGQETASFCVTWEVRSYDWTGDLTAKDLDPQSLDPGAWNARETDQAGPASENC